MQILIKELPDGRWLVSWINFIGQQRSEILATLNGLQDLINQGREHGTAAQ